MLSAEAWTAVGTVAGLVLLVLYSVLNP